MKKEDVTQIIRAVDVVVITPLMFAAASNKNLPTGLRIALGITGAATGIYNTYNFFTHLK